MKKDFIVRRSITMVEGKPYVETYSEQELVLCKDCKWFHQAFKGEGRCLKHDNDYHKPNWFCADGEREE